MTPVSVAQARLFAELSADTVRPGLLGLLVVLGLAVATVFLMRSFVKQLRRIDFDEEHPDDSPAADGHGVERAGGTEPDVEPPGGTAGDPHHGAAGDPHGESSDEQAPPPR